LAERSLIHQEESPSAPRFGMLETIRDYVIAHTDPNDLRRYRQRHAAVVAKHQILASRKLFGTEQHRWYEAMRTELDNSHVAIEWSADHDGKLAAMLGTALWRYWCARGLPGEGAHYLDRILSHPDQPRTPHWAETYLGRGKIATIQGDDELASEWFEKGLEAFVAEDYAWGRSWARFLLACSKYDEGRIRDAAKYSEQSLEGANALTIHYIKFILGKSLARLGQVERGVAIAEDGFASIIADEQQMSIGWAYASLAEVYREVGQVDAAFALISEGLVRLRAESIRDYVLEATVRLARLELRRQKSDRVRELIGEARPLAQELGHCKSEMWVMAIEGSLAALSGDLLESISRYESALRKSRPRGGAMVALEICRMLASDLLSLGKVELANHILAAEAGLRAHLEFPLSPLETAELADLQARLGSEVEPMPTRSTSELVAVALKGIAHARVD
jgi:tetratricopeptide (TPR) repeat protein